MPCAKVSGIENFGNRADKCVRSSSSETSATSRTHATGRSCQVSCGTQSRPRRRRPGTDPWHRVVGHEMPEGVPRQGRHSECRTRSRVHRTCRPPCKWLSRVPICEFRFGAAALAGSADPVGEDVLGPPQQRANRYFYVWLFDHASASVLIPLLAHALEICQPRAPLARGVRDSHPRVLDGGAVLRDLPAAHGLDDEGSRTGPSDSADHTRGADRRGGTRHAADLRRLPRHHAGPNQVVLAERARHPSRSPAGPSPEPGDAGSGMRIMRNELNSPMRPARIGTSSAT